MKPAILSMNTLVNMAGTSDGSVNSTAPRAATGAKMMTLKPRYATNIRKTSAARMTMNSYISRTR